MAVLKNNAVLTYLESGSTITANAKVDFDVLGESVLFTKIVTPTSGLVGSKATFTLTATNSNVLKTVQNLLFVDDLPSRMKLVSNSIKLDGVVISGDLSTGISAGNLAPLQTKVLTFDVTILQ